MSNIDKMLEITSANQDLFVDLNEKSAETISGGAKVFTIKNNTKYTVGYYLDGAARRQKPGTSLKWTAHRGGKITFDRDVRPGVKQMISSNLAHGGVYAFRPNVRTPNPYDLGLYKV